MDSTDPSDPPVVRHAVRTYGKSRRQPEEEPPVARHLTPTRDAPTDDGDTNLNDQSLSADASRSSLDRMLTSIPSSPAAGEFPPDSSDCDLSMSRDVEEDDDSDRKGVPLTSFGWKDAIRAIDSEDDFAGAGSSKGRTAFARVRRSVNAVVGNIYGKSPPRPKRANNLEHEDAHEQSDDDEPSVKSTLPSGDVDVALGPARDGITYADDEGKPSTIQHDEPSSQPPQSRLHHPHARHAILDSDSDHGSDSNLHKRDAKPRDADIAGRRRSVHGHRRASRSRSDSSSQASASPETSPGKLHHITTPTSGAKTSADGQEVVTPPTSQEGLAMAHKVEKKMHRKNRASVTGSESGRDDSDGQRKADGSSIGDVDMGEGIDGPRAKEKGRTRRREEGKETRVKAPTKKERLEAQKATARIKADTQATIARSERQLPLTALFSKLIPTHTQLARNRGRSGSIEPSLAAISSSLAPPASANGEPSSDPIQQFSSPAPYRHATPPASAPKRMTLFPNGLLGLGGHSASMSTGKARDKQRLASRQLRGKERGGSVDFKRGVSLTFMAMETDTPDADVFAAPSATTDKGKATDKGKGKLVLPQVMSGSDAEDEESDSDDEMPDVQTILAQRAERDAREAARRAKEEAEEENKRKLREAKLVFLERQKEQQARSARSPIANEGADTGRGGGGGLADSAEDDDLEIVDDDMHEVAKEEGKLRIARRGVRESEGRARQLRYAHVKPQSKSQSKAKGAPTGPATAQELNRMLLGASEKQSREVTLQKEQDFYRRGVGGGELPSERWREMVEREKVGGEARREERIKELAEWGIENAALQEMKNADYSDDDDDDENWGPEGEGMEEGEDEEGSEAPHDLPIATDDEEIPPGDENMENDENADSTVVHAPHRHHTRVIVDSDGEDGEASPGSFGRVLVADTSAVLDPLPDDDNDQENDQENTTTATLLPRPTFLSHRPSVSVSSFEDAEGTDKENNALLMFDRGEDKENTAVASQPILPSSPFTSQRLASGSLMLSPTGGVRSPLMEITRESAGDDDEDVFAYVGPGISERAQGAFTRRGSSPGLALELEARPSSPDVFEAPSSDGPVAPKPLDADIFKTPGPPSSLQPAAVIMPGAAAGFSQFFEETQAATAGAAPFVVSKGFDSFSQFETPAKTAGMGGFDKLRPPSDVKLTMSTKRLRPSPELDESLLQKADAIFEHEQENIAGAALELPSVEKPKKYIGEFGFFTQTAPDSAFRHQESSPMPLITPLIKGMQSSSQPSTIRRPLGTLSETPIIPLDLGDDGDGDDDEQPRRGRLRKRATSFDDAEGGYHSDRSPSPVKRNAFEVLGKLKAPQFPTAKPKQKTKEKLGDNEFIEGEAVESDEEVNFGFGLLRKKDDEELDGEDLDASIPEMLNDTEMDEETLNEEKVLEKVQEHRAIDDAADEKIARDAAEGKMRAKRRTRGIDFDSEESDEEDPDMKRRRQKLHKKRKIDGDTLDALEKHPETQAFVQAYHAEMDDDNEEFSHLDKDDFTSLRLHNDEAEADVDDENEPQEVLTTADLRQQLQQAAREKNFQVIDPEDVSWANIDADADMDDEDFRVKEIAAVSKRPPAMSRMDTMESWDVPSAGSRGGSAQDIAREQKWARSEGGSRIAGTGRGSAAVTSLVKGNGSSSKSAAGVGGGSLGSRGFKGRAVPAPVTRVPGTSRQPPKLTKAPSTLAGLSRRGKFTK